MTGQLAALPRAPNPRRPLWMRAAVATSVVAVAATATWLVVRKVRGPQGYPWPRPADKGIGWATGDPRPLWPVANNSTHARRLEVAYTDEYGDQHGNPSRRFMASRDGRNHVGIDLYANAGDVVLAPEDGVVVQTQTFLNGTDAIMIQGDHDVTVLLGEVGPGSWKEFGVAEGSVVKKGDPVARVGVTNAGSHMLHFETYWCCPLKNYPWYKGHAAFELTADPTDYLLRAMAGELSVA